jgi:hypothetical protein
MSKKLAKALEDLPPDWFKLSPAAKAEFEKMRAQTEASNNAMWCLCPKMLTCEYLKQGKYCR